MRWEGLRPSLEKFCLKSIFGNDNDIYDGGDVGLREKELPFSSKSHDVAGKEEEEQASLQIFKLQNKAILEWRCSQ